MKKTILSKTRTIITITLFAAISLTACGKSGPKKIEGLIVPDCKTLTADLQKNNPKATQDEIYKGAADILFSDERAEEAVVCCDNIVDPKVQTECKRVENK